MKSKKKARVEEYVSKISRILEIILYKDYKDYQRIGDLFNMYLRAIKEYLKGMEKYERVECFESLFVNVDDDFLKACRRVIKDEDIVNEIKKLQQESVKIPRNFYESIRLKARQGYSIKLTDHRKLQIIYVLGVYSNLYKDNLERLPIEVPLSKSSYIKKPKVAVGVSITIGGIIYLLATMGVIQSLLALGGLIGNIPSVWVSIIMIIVGVLLLSHQYLTSRGKKRLAEYKIYLTSKEGQDLLRVAEELYEEVQESFDNIQKIDIERKLEDVANKIEKDLRERYPNIDHAALYRVLEDAKEEAKKLSEEVYRKIVKGFESELKDIVGKLTSIKKLDIKDHPKEVLDSTIENLNKLKNTFRGMESNTLPNIAEITLSLSLSRKVTENAIGEIEEIAGEIGEAREEVCKNISIRVKSKTFSLCGDQRDSILSRIDALENKLKSISSFEDYEKYEEDWKEEIQSIRDSVCSLLESVDEKEKEQLEKQLEGLKGFEQDPKLSKDLESFKKLLGDAKVRVQLNALNYIYDKILERIHYSAKNRVEMLIDDLINKIGKLSDYDFEKFAEKLDERLRKVGREAFTLRKKQRLRKEMIYLFGGWEWEEKKSKELLINTLVDWKSLLRESKKIDNPEAIEKAVLLIKGVLGEVEKEREEWETWKKRKKFKSCVENLLRSEINDIDEILTEVEKRIENINRIREIELELGAKILTEAYVDSAIRSFEDIPYYIEECKRELERTLNQEIEDLMTYGRITEERLRRRVRKLGRSLKPFLENAIQIRKEFVNRCSAAVENYYNNLFFGLEKGDEKNIIDKLRNNIEKLASESVKYDSKTVFRELRDACQSAIEDLRKLYNDKLLEYSREKTSIAKVYIDRIFELLVFLVIFAGCLEGKLSKKAILSHISEIKLRKGAFAE